MNLLVKSVVYLDRYGRDITKYPNDYTDQVWDIIHFENSNPIIQKHSYDVYYLNSRVTSSRTKNARQKLKDCFIRDAFEDLPLWFIENYYHDLPENAKFIEFECYV